MLQLVSVEPSKVPPIPSPFPLRNQLTKAENNLFLVKRLVQRTDMRNTDPGAARYTSLAWAAVMGHEETFDFLLSSGHDDEELSKVCFRTSPL
jgi:ankyrin repeat protein